MARQLLLICLMVSFAAFATAQVVILDHEAPATSGVFNYFAQPGPPTSTIIANPDPSGINTSATVGEFIRTATGATFAGGISPNTLAPIEFSGAATEVCIKVWREELGTISLKLEASSNGGPNWLFTKNNTVVNEWEEICFQVAFPSIEPPFLPAAAFDYNTFVLFVDFGDIPAEDRIVYIDDVVVKSATTSATIPTMGQWSLFCLALIMLNLGIVFVLQLQSRTALSTTNGATIAAPKFSIRQIPFDWKGFSQAFKVTLLLVPFGFAFIYFVWGEIIFDDIVGMVLTIPLVAYLIFLLKK